jgi:hypothetical protein
MMKNDKLKNAVLIADTEKQFIYLDKDENTKNTALSIDVDKAMPVLDIKEIKCFSFVSRVIQSFKSFDKSISSGLQKQSTCFKYISYKSLC